MEARPASSITAERLARLFNASFKGYVGWSADFSGETLLAWCDRCFVSLERSYIFFLPHLSSTATDPDEPVAFGLIAEREDRPGHARLAGMGVALSVQGQGIGSQAIELILHQERERGMKQLELECVSDNERALKLYGRAGFEVLRQLSGWQKEPIGLDEEGESQDSDGLEACTIEEVDALVKRYSVDDLPWQAGFVSRLTIANQGFKLGHAYCVISDPDEDQDTIKLASMVVKPEFRGQGEGTRLAKAVLRRFRGKGKKWSLHPIYPREFGEGIARRVGAREADINQVQMRVRL